MVMSMRSSTRRRQLPQIDGIGRFKWPASASNASYKVQSKLMKACCGSLPKSPPFSPSVRFVAECQEWIVLSGIINLVRFPGPVLIDALVVYPRAGTLCGTLPCTCALRCCISTAAAPVSRASELARHQIYCFKLGFCGRIGSAGILLAGEKEGITSPPKQATRS